MVQVVQPSQTNVMSGNVTSRSQDAGLYPTECGTATPGTPIRCPRGGLTVAKFVKSDTSGGILVVNKDGIHCWLSGVAANQLTPFMFSQILSSGTDWEGNSRTTVSANFQWYGGE